MTGARGAVTALGAGLAVAAAIHQQVNLRALRLPSTGTAPVTGRVSVLVPARDEAHRIAPTVRSLLAQTGLRDVQILVLDDGSTDGTADVVRAAAGDDPRLRVLTGRPPRAGVPGKPNACAQLAAAADGAVLVFVDADVVLEPGAVAASVAMLRSTELDLLCPWPRQLADGVLPRLVQPLQVWSWSALLPLRRAESSARRSLVAANGQFLLVDADALRRAGGFAAVDGEVLDDMALARAVRRSGGRTGIADGSAIASCRMYDDGAELAAGYEKSLWAAFGSGPGAVAVAGLLALAYVVPPVASLGGSRAGLLGYGAAVLSRAVAARRTGTRVWPDALAHPASVAVLLVLLARSWVGRLRGTLSWKGRPLR